MPKNQTLTVLIIAKYEPTFDWVQMTIQEQDYQILGRVESIDQAMRKLSRAEVDILLVDTSAEGVLETQWLQKLAVQSPNTLTLVIATTEEMDFIREAMLAGAQGFLLKPFDLTELSRSIEQVHQLWLQRYARLNETHERPSTRRAHSIAVFSPKGGTGATVLAINLAVALRQQTGSSVLLVDADISAPDVDIFMNIFSEHSLIDLLQLKQGVDSEILESVITEHNSGIEVIRGDANLQFIDAPIEPGQMGELIERIINYWDGYVVINTSNNLDRWTVEILDAVETVLLVTTPQLPSLRAMRNFLELAEAETDENDKWQLVMNGYQSQKVLRMSDVEESIHFPIKMTLTHDPELVSASINRGSPLLISHSNSALARDIINLARQLANVTSPSQDTPSVTDMSPPSSGKEKSKRFSFRQLFVNALHLERSAS